MSKKKRLSPEEIVKKLDVLGQFIIHSDVTDLTVWAVALNEDEKEKLLDSVDTIEKFVTDGEF